MILEKESEKSIHKCNKGHSMLRVTSLGRYYARNDLYVQCLGENL